MRHPCHSLLILCTTPSCPVLFDTTQRKRNFQEEIDFHEAAVRKRRDAMLREQVRACVRGYACCTIAIDPHRHHPPPLTDP